MMFRTDRPPTWQACGECGNELPVNDARARCPVCGGLLELQHRAPDLTRDQLIERFNTRQRRGLDAPASGVWRFRDVVLPGAERVISHPEGNTPLLHREALDRYTGLSRLLLKHEGHNPTGSFKDRGMTVGVTQAVRLGVYLLNSINPFRIEGQKTIVLELLQQLAWRPPDWIVVPAGNLGNTSAFGKALVEARELGLITKLPRIAAVQAAGASPFYKSYRVGFRRRFKVKAETLATAIRIGNPASFERGALAIRRTRGVVAAVSDAEILAAKAVIDAAGIGCEPASAATIAGIRQLVRRGTIRRSATVVAVLTGNVLKDPQAVIDFHLSRARAANRPVEIEAKVSEVARLLPNVR